MIMTDAPLEINTQNPWILRKMFFFLQILMSVTLTFNIMMPT